MYVNGVLLHTIIFTEKPNFESEGAVQCHMSKWAIGDLNDMLVGIPDLNLRQHNRRADLHLYHHSTLHIIAAHVKLIFVTSTMIYQTCRSD